MTSAIRLAIIALVLVLLLGLGAWYYLFGPNKIAAADLVPSDTLVFATIPNAARIVADYQSSQLKQLVDAPEAQPTRDQITSLLSAKNLDLLQTFAPELSGQSFFAVTHFDPANPAKVGLIGGLKPKPGTGNFTDFVAKWKATYPELVAQATTGAGNVEGLDYQWIRGPGGSDKICVAQTGGWIITAWGEDSLRDWWERFEKKSATPSLAANADYQKSIKRVGINSEAFLYLDYHAFITLLQQQMARTNPSGANYLGTRLAGIGGVAIGSTFDHGEIKDTFSMLMPRAAQTAAGMPSGPCAFDTLKFTGPDTRLYWGATANFAQSWKNLQEQAGTSPSANPFVSTWVTNLRTWAQSKNLDVQRNIIGPLGNEFSLQAEWGSDSSYPEAGIFVKLDKPDDFKPTIAAIIDTVRQMFSTTAVITEINSGGQNFATLKFIQAFPISPTITEDGPYLGVFLSENQAVRSFKRDASVGLLNNEDFKRQIGDNKNNASQMIFVDSPQLLNRGYQTALPYVSLAAMFNKTLGAMIQGRTLPPDLQWLTPIGTWSFVSSSDDDGISGYSVSGIGNQGIFMSGGLGAGMVAMQFLRHPAPPPPIPLMPPVPPAPAPAVIGSTPLAPPPAAAPAMTAPPAPPPPVPAPAAAPAPTPVAPPDASGSSSDSTANPAPPPSNAPPPAPAPATNQ